MTTPAGSTTVALQSLLDRLANGDAEAETLLIGRAIERLTLIARRLLNSFGGEKRVELWSTEVVSEAYPRISKAIKDVRPQSVPQFLGLARLQMHRVLLDKVRALKARKEDQGVDVVAANDKLQLDLVIDLMEAVGELPERQAETVWFKLAGYTHKEIAEFLGVHHDTVDTYWHAACVKLQKRLAPFMEHFKST